MDLYDLIPPFTLISRVPNLSEDLTVMLIYHPYAQSALFLRTTMVFTTCVFDPLLIKQGRLYAKVNKHLLAKPISSLTTSSQEIVVKYLL